MRHNIRTFTRKFSSFSHQLNDFHDHSKECIVEINKTVTLLEGSHQLHRSTRKHLEKVILKQFKILLNRLKHLYDDFSSLSHFLIEDASRTAKHSIFNKKKLNSLIDEIKKSPASKQLIFTSLQHQYKTIINSQRKVKYIYSAHIDSPSTNEDVKHLVYNLKDFKSQLVFTYNSFNQMKQLLFNHDSFVKKSHSDITCSFKTTGKICILDNNFVSKMFDLYKDGWFYSIKFSGDVTYMTPEVKNEIDAHYKSLSSTDKETYSMFYELFTKAFNVKIIHIPFNSTNQQLMVDFWNQYSKKSNHTSEHDFLRTDAKILFLAFTHPNYTVLSEDADIVDVIKDCTRFTNSVFTISRVTCKANPLV
ncbi:MAG: hypothetical protein ACOCU6_03125 [Nanoarchaeota archaeon]